jgi:hypothetical protein
MPATRSGGGIQYLKFEILLRGKDNAGLLQSEE